MLLYDIIGVMCVNSYSNVAIWYNWSHVCEFIF